MAMRFFGLLLAAALAAAAPACAQLGNPEVRIKDIAHVQGVSTNFLIGYGLVVGLANTGDNAGAITNVSLANMLERMQITQIKADDIRARNVAVVMVTATMAPFAKSGDALDITVSSVGDARSLQGGTLLMTPLKAADNKVYALAQGALSTGGFNQASGLINTTKNHELVGRVPGGGSLVRDLPATASQDSGQLTITLNEPDATTASKMAAAIRDSGLSAEAVNPATIRVEAPSATAFSGNRVDLVAKVEQVTLRPDHVARVVINERTGTVVMGGEVRLGPVAVAHGNLRLVIQQNAAAYGARTSLGAATGYPSAVTSGAGNVGASAGQVGIGIKSYSVMTMPVGATLRDVTDALNTIGVTPRDLIAIIQALKQAGALDAMVVTQ